MKNLTKQNKQNNFLPHVTIIFVRQGKNFFLFIMSTILKIKFFVFLKHPKKEALVQFFYKNQILRILEFHLIFKI